MVNPLVERATSDLLVGPDWAKNSEICDILIHDPGQVKDVVKGIRRRIGSKSPKVQILALTLLEMLMNNCGDFVHMHVAERGVLRKMMKIAKKKRNYHVREKILMLIDNWQEAFGGPGSRHPQYYAAFYGLSRAGVVFPRRSDRRSPIFTPQQAQSYPPNLQNPDHQQEAAELSEESDFPTLSLSEIQNARSIVDVLAEMLNGLEPGNEESLRQDAIVDLVQQCRTYKQRVVHLINSTSDESLLSQGLALNDDLQRLLAKHEAIVSGNSAELETKPLQALIDIDDPVVTTEGSNKQPDEKTLSTNPANQSSIDLLLPAATSDGSLTLSTQRDAVMDLLSGGDSSSPTAENSLALVPVVGEPPENSPAFQQNNIDLSDMFTQNNIAENSFDPQSTYPTGQAFPSTPELQYQQNQQGPHAAIYSDGSALDMGSAQYQQQQNELLVNGTQGSSYLPPPPWEIQAADNQQPVHPHYQQEFQMTQDVVTHSQPVHNNMHSHPVDQSNQAVGMYVQPLPSSQMAALHSQPIQSHQLAGMHQSLQGSSMMGMVQQGGDMYYQSIQSNQHPGYGSHPQYLEQRMYGLTMGNDSAAHNSPYQASTPSYMQPSMRPRPEDKLFGDLVSIAKSKPKNSSLHTPNNPA